MNHIVTPDICDAHPEVRILDPLFANFGGVESFCGPVRTVKCFEDNSRVKEAVAEPGEGAVLVVDGGGSLRCALLGDMLAEKAADNGWSGVIVYGCVRDVDVLAETELGVQALGAHPRRSEKRGEGQRDIAVTFAGVTLHPGQWVYADNNGILVAESRLTLDV
ncbi:ribonuclease E activity regulator RraA [Halomonas sp. McH1-25]|uniref:ribonuclease E activity regulator RraA n=1 Tax=unclassified Halomonas TaxID=2609666 RepID=UPI001EF490F1|nr:MULTISPECIES: ribonuclease E activity regulator RraA [unclassified Halomonas]MCG7598697.1 ribonuclease E activity regulator RraA [Halomonas sp. McH1-25]MCP1340660.1 ribonuclease E activity regulator RraA [Halomonas sp. FL8]MCP1359431.1 ribonuclease E activity regulator RraA [Halomonas sp. BBD45]MCP1364615.1 ribonuclease E activity regulator RraA [Halomonas sp. BBD48]